MCMRVVDACGRHRALNAITPCSERQRTSDKLSKSIPTLRALVITETPRLSSDDRRGEKSELQPDALWCVWAAADARWSTSSSSVIIHTVAVWASNTISGHVAHCSFHPRASCIPARIAPGSTAVHSVFSSSIFGELNLSDLIPRLLYDGTSTNASTHSSSSSSIVDHRHHHRRLTASSRTMSAAAAIGSLRCLIEVWTWLPSK